MKNFSITLVVFIILQLTVFGQMQRFSKQNPDSSYNVSFVLASQHTLLFFWYSGSQLLLSRSADAVNWSDAVAIKSGIAIAPIGEPNEITGIVLSSGRIFLVYRNVFYYSVYSDNNGLTWSAPVTLPTGTNLVNYRLAHFGSITQTSTGKLLLVYTKSSTVLSIASSDTGSTWGKEQTLPLTSDIATISTINNKVILVYSNQGLYSSFSSDDGITWASPGTLILNDTVNTPKVVTDESARLWLFYQRIIPSPFQGINQQDILYKTSTDGGFSWSSENNFTTYKGFDGYYNISGNFNNPPVSFSSTRLENPTVYNLWYGTAGLTNDNNAPSVFYKYVLSDPSPKAGQQFNIDAYIDYNNAAPVVSLNRILNGNSQSSLTMYDDGTHGDSVANDKIFTCQVPGISIFDVLQTQISITDLPANPAVYNGPTIRELLSNNISSILMNVNRFKLPVGNNGVLGDIVIPPQTMGGGTYDGNIVLFSGGFYMSGYSNGKLWSNGQITASRISDYVPGKVGSKSK